MSCAYRPGGHAVSRFDQTHRMSGPRDPIPCGHSFVLKNPEYLEQLPKDEERHFDNN